METSKLIVIAVVGSAICGVMTSFIASPLVGWAVALGLGLLALVGITGWQRHHEAETTTEPEGSTTFDNVDFDEIDAEVDSTAQTVARNSRARRWRGLVRHRPGGQ